MDKAHVIWGFQWLLYCFLHSFLANSYVKEQVVSGLNIPVSFYRVVYNAIALVHLAILVYFHVRLESEEIYTSNPLTTSTGILMMSAGGSIMLACIRKYFRQLSGAFKSVHRPTLYTGGLHQFVRHPLYLGTFLFLLGALVYWPLLKNALVVTIIIAYTLIGMLLEEKKLLQEFGEDYRHYQQKVPMIIPRLTVGKKKTKGATESVP